MKKILLISTIGIGLGIGLISWSTNTNGTPRVGQKAIDLNYESPDGDMLALQSLEGHVVLLDFWASWCGPCRRKNPSIVALYDKYQGQKFIKGTEGFEVYSVSLDKNRERWLGAIEKDNLLWDYHVSDLKGWACEGAAKYGVRSIPTTYLIDEEGYVIGINLSSAAIEMELDKRLKKKK